jgi:hypothetical protein
MLRALRRVAYLVEVHALFVEIWPKTGTPEYVAAQSGNISAALKVAAQRFQREHTTIATASPAAAKRGATVVAPTLSKKRALLGTLKSDSLSLKRLNGDLEAQA